MRKYLGALVAAGLVFAMFTASALAQPRGGGDRRGGDRRQFDPFRELGLEGQKAEDARAIYQKYREGMREWYTANRDALRAGGEKAREMATKAREGMQKNMEAQLAAVLTPQELEKFKASRTRRRSPFGGSGPRRQLMMLLMLAGRLNLSTVQQKAMDEAVAEAYKVILAAVKLTEEQEKIREQGLTRTMGRRGPPGGGEGGRRGDRPPPPPE